MSLLNQLISYWRLDEDSGTRRDAHGANHLTDNNTVTSAAGKIGRAARFVAANSESLSVASNATVQAGNVDFTVAFWLWPDSVTATQYLFAKYAGGTNSNYRLYKSNASNLGFGIIDAAGAMTELVTGAVLTAAAWNFVVAWHDAAADTVNVQVNNGAVASLATGGRIPNAAATAALRLGGSDTGTLYLGGLIDGVGFWKRVLTAAERTQLYNNGNGLDFLGGGHRRLSLKMGLGL